MMHSAELIDSHSKVFGFFIFSFSIVDAKGARTRKILQFVLPSGRVCNKKKEIIFTFFWRRRRRAGQ